jgi:hypothetical protein
MTAPPVYELEDQVVLFGTSGAQASTTLFLRFFLFHKFNRISCFSLKQAEFESSYQPTNKHSIIRERSSLPLIERDKLDIRLLFI